MNSPALTVWCASFPKSGNTWVRALFAGAMGDGTVRLSNLGGQTLGNDQAAIFREFGLSPSVLDDRLSYALMSEVGASLALRSTEPLFRKTHNSFRGALPRGASHTLRVPAQAIYIVRDPRAVAVSLAHHLGCSQAEAVTVMAVGPQESMSNIADQGEVDETLTTQDRFVLRGCRVALDWGSWSQNVVSWLDQTDVPVTLARYEDLCGDTEGVMSKLVEQLGVSVPAARLRLAVKESSFEHLAIQELLEGFCEASSPDRSFFRRGEPDSWSSELESGLEQRIISDHGDVMHQLGYVA